MKITEININDIHPYENNPRINDDAVDAVAASIQEFGWKQPIVVDEQNVIIAGHTRYKAALKLGLTAIPCVVASDLTDEQVKAFRIADNKTGELADWDFGKLDEELSRIIDVDMTKFGFSLDMVFEDENGSGAKELDTDDFADDTFTCQCPKCGFRFNA